MLFRSNQKIVIVVQARMGSTRLPGKSLRLILGQPLLGYLIERLKRVKLADELIVATTNADADQAIADFCIKKAVLCIRGSEEDVLDRYKQAADSGKATVIVRISGDCPLIDPAVVDKVIKQFIDRSPEVDYVSNTLTRTYPRGMDVEVMSKQALDKAHKEAKLPEEREHVTPYIYRHPELFHLLNVPLPGDLSNLRLTVDTQEDFELIKLILEELYPTNQNFSLEDILKAFNNHPEWKSINAEVKQKNIDER